MSISSVPQRLVSRLIGREQPTVAPDDPIARMISRTTGRIRPERTYRWRLRGRVVNEYVAQREGLVPPIPPRRASMGSLGRAVLFASVALAISVSAVGAASSSALPGDPLYGVKRQVEELRMEIAPPSVRPALAAMALEERLSEVELLAAAGNWARAALGEQEVESAVVTLRTLGGSLTSDQLAALQHHTQVLTALLARAPSAALPGLERALAASAGVAAAANPGGHLGHGNANGASETGSNGNQGSAGNGNTTNNGKNDGRQGGGKPTDGVSTATPAPTQTPESQAPHPHGSPNPHPAEQPADSASAPPKASPSH